MAVKFQDYYQTLDVSRDASQDKIRSAFRKAARRYHPDVNKDPKAEDKFKQVNEAYEVLGDTQKRKQFDTLGANWKAGQEFRPPPGHENFTFQFRGQPGVQGGGPGGAGDNAGGFSFTPGGQFSDFFETLFGRGDQRSAGGDMFEPFAGRQQVQSAEFPVTLEEVFHGASKTLSLRGPQGDKVIDVKIPAGVADGSTIRLRGQGIEGGDLLLRVSVAPDPRFTVAGADLTTQVPVTPWDAALGAKVDVATLSGSVTVTIPPGTASGQKLRLRGKGMPALKGVAAGDLFAHVNIVVPKTLTDEQRKLFEQLRDISTSDPRKQGE
ncbi:MAG: DnaJ C-terminal domain-containing protein [Phycisphaeraceae bacterium]|jgi:curved DNA-binding protein|nr:DnaJ C-terminal domain-containing protein [Phycisphaeraceae bacterium]